MAVGTGGGVAIAPADKFWGFTINNGCDVATIANYD